MSNNEKTLEIEYFSDRVISSLRQLDTNRDGILSRSEARQVTRHPDTGLLGVRMENATPINLAAAAEKVAHSLNKYDVNHDGQLSSTERQALPNHIRPVAEALSR